MPCEHIQLVVKPMTAPGAGRGGDRYIRWFLTVGGVQWSWVMTLGARRDGWLTKFVGGESGRRSLGCCGLLLALKSGKRCVK